jgi:hypothetical protein
MHKLTAFDLPKMTLTEKFDHDRELILSEMREAPTMLAFYRTKEGDNRCVFTELCESLFMFLLVVLNRNIEIFDIVKKAIEVIEKLRNEELDAQSFMIEAIEYIKLKIKN